MIADLEMTSLAVNYNGNRLYADNGANIDIQVTIENSSPTDPVPQATGNMKNYEFAVILSDKDISRAGTNNGLTIAAIPISFTGAEEAKMQDGLYDLVRTDFYVLHRQNVIV